MHPPASAPDHAGGIAAATHAILPRPVLRPWSAQRSGYLLHYELHSDQPECIVQQVGVQIVFSQGNQWLVSYRSRYYEFFELLEAGRSVVDRHDFDLVRDGWSQAAIEELRCRWLSPEMLRTSSGTVCLRVQKTFVLGRARVAGVSPAELSPGVRFGFLGSLGGSAPRARILLYAGGKRRPLEIPNVTPWPSWAKAAGSGSFSAQNAWKAQERYRYDFACLSGSLQEVSGYCNVTRCRSVTPGSSHANCK